MFCFDEENMFLIFFCKTFLSKKNYCYSFFTGVIIKDNSNSNCNKGKNGI